MSTKNLQSMKSELVEVLEVKRNKAISKGKSDRAYELTTWLNFINRQASKPQIAALHYEYRTNENIQPNSNRLTLF